MCHLFPRRFLTFILLKIELMVRTRVGVIDRKTQHRFFTGFAGSGKNWKIVLNNKWVPARCYYNYYFKINNTYYKLISPRTCIRYITDMTQDEIKQFKKMRKEKREKRRERRERRNRLIITITKSRQILLAAWNKY